MSNGSDSIEWRIRKIRHEPKEIRIEHFCTHTLRKTFGRKVLESTGGQAEMALVRLMELFNHSSVSITKRYLGIRQKELLETDDLLFIL